MNKSLTPEEVFKIAGIKGNILRYNEIQDYNKIDDILKNGACLILYQTHYDPEVITGHWTCVVKNNKNNITFFDSYGTFPDDQHDQIDKEYAHSIDQAYPALSKLLLECPYKIHYNPHQLQKYGDDIATCGRHCGLYMRYKKIPVEEFCNFILDQKKKGYNLDELIVEMTNKYLN